MRKRIAVYLGESTGDFQAKMTRFLANYANELGYDVVAFCTYGTYNDDYLYAEGEKACIHLPDFSQFDGVVLTEDVFNIDGMADEIYEIIKRDCSCPVVYIRSTREDCYSVLYENTGAITSMVQHLVEHHGFRDILYMSGKKGARDAMERLKGYMDTMASYGIPVTEHMIFHGDYWREKGKEAVDWFMEGRTTYPQAIVCANDFMALSICEELEKRGVRVPEDVCVTGYDYSIEGRQTTPSLTTFAVDADKVAQTAIEIIDGVGRGEHKEEVVTVLPKMILRESCGCDLHDHEEPIPDITGEAYKTILSMKHMMLATTEYQDAFEEDEYLWVAEKYSDLFRSENVYLCLCDTNEEGYSEVENDSLFSKRMILRRIFQGDGKAEKVSIPFNRTDIIPPEMLQEGTPKNLMIFSVHFKNIVFGYLAAEFPEGDWFDTFTQGYIMSLANAMENAVIQKKLADLEVIRALYQKDALTGLYNRRGFDKQLRDQLSKQNSDEEFFAVSIDMDNLKLINDTYGHMEGDNAIMALAKALDSVMEKNEFCARNGGDEFSAFLRGTSPQREQQFLVDFEKAIEQANRTSRPYQISASVGICAFHEEPGDSLVACIQKADMRMYENKKKRKGRGRS